MSFYFAIAYLVAEYMRPQAMYAALSGLPLVQISIIGLIVSFILEGRRLANSNYQNLLILLYLFWFSMSSLFALNRELAWQPLIDFSKWVVIYFLLINTLTDKKKLYIFLIIFLLINFKYAQFAVRLWVDRGFYTDPRGFHEGGGIGSGFIRNPNDFGVAMNSVLGISYYMIRSDINKVFNWFKLRWFHIFATVAFALSVVACSSRGALLALGMAFLGVWYKSKRRFLAIPILLIICVATLALIPEDNWARFQAMGTEADSGGSMRLRLWRSGIEMSTDHPLFGVGPNNFIDANQNYYDADLHHVQHNVFIQAASELGYPGLFILLLMMKGCLSNHRKTRELLKSNAIKDPFLYGLSHGLDICILGFAVNGLFITVLYYPFFWTLLYLSVALLGITKHVVRQSEAKLNEKTTGRLAAY
jgi:hypothetical protein